VDGGEDNGMTHHRSTGPTAVQQDPLSADARLTQLRADLLGGFGQGADTEQVQAHTRDRPPADAAPPLFERARTATTEAPMTYGGGSGGRRVRSSPKAALGGFLLGVLLTLRLRRSAS
jgi:hypothetical protein